MTSNPGFHTAGQIFDGILAQAKDNVSQAQSNAPEPTPNPPEPDQQTQALTALSAHLHRQEQANAELQRRLAQLEGRQAPPSQGEDSWQRWEQETGIRPEVLREATRAEARVQAEKLFEEKFGPVVREAEAIQQYQRVHPDFNLTKFNTYVAGHPDVAQVVQDAAQRGAYRTGIEYAELRRVMDEKIAGQAEGETRVDKRKQLVTETRPDAQVVGGGNPAPGGRNVNPAAMTPEQLQHIYAHADAGNWGPFERAFVASNLPSEEEFQRIAQS